MQIPEELEARLVNWGRSIHGGRQTYKSWLAKFQTPDPKAPPITETRRTPVNELDAMVVNTIWQSMPGEHYDDRRAKFLVAAMYSSGTNEAATLKKLRCDYQIRIRPGEVDRLMEKALKYMGRRLGYVVY